MNRIIIAFLIGILLISCAVHHGSISAGTTNGTEKYVDVACGISSANRFLGIGGLGKDALLFEAKRNMQQSRPLANGEFYANYTIDEKRTFYPFMSKTKITVFADVLSSTTDNTKYSNSYKKAMLKDKDTSYLFEIGDSVVFGLYKKVGKIVLLQNDSSAVILFKTKVGGFKTKVCSVKEIFNKSKNDGNLIIGNEHVLNFPSGLKRTGNIYAIGQNSLLVKYNKSIIQIQRKDHK